MLRASLRIHACTLRAIHTAEGHGASVFLPRDRRFYIPNEGFSKLLPDSDTYSSSGLCHEVLHPSSEAGFSSAATLLVWGKPIFSDRCIPGRVFCPAYRSASSEVGRMCGIRLAPPQLGPLRFQNIFQRRDIAGKGCNSHVICPQRIRWFRPQSLLHLPGFLPRARKEWRRAPRARDPTNGFYRPAHPALRCQRVPSRPNHREPFVYPTRTPATRGRHPARNRTSLAPACRGAYPAGNLPLVARSERRAGQVDRGTGSLDGRN